MARRLSERLGLTQPRVTIQVDSLDTDTRTALWNGIYLARKAMNSTYGWNEESVAELMWTDHFRKHRDQFNSAGYVWPLVKTTIVDGTWIAALDVIEAEIHAINNFAYGTLAADLRDHMNELFEGYLVGFRFIDFELARLDSQTEVSAIEDANDAASGLAGVRHHLSNALAKLSDRSNPDYPNSVKESLSAVESLGEKITGKSTLGAAMDALIDVGIVAHPAQLKAWKAMYGWASDADGIRHSARSIPNVDQRTAKYTLVTASAFVSYLIEAAREARIRL